MVLIDIFIKFCLVVPVKSKQPADVLAGMMEGMKKHSRKPKLIYSDEEGSLKSEVALSYLKEEKIELHRTRGHPSFAEAFIRTFKNIISGSNELRMMTKMGKRNIQWTLYITETMLTYNEKLVHSAIQMTPKEARQPKNEIKAKLNMSMRARRTRVYPELEINDEIKIMGKKDITEKERTSHWLKEQYKVKRIEKK